MPLLFAHLLDAVVAIGTKDPKDKMRWVASGFLYGSFTKKMDANKQKLYNTYLVSNRHVFEGLDPAFIRVNPKNVKQPPVDFQLLLKDPKTGRNKWYAHSNPDVDIAVFPVSTRLLKARGMNVSFYPSDEFTATRQQLSALSVTEGDFAYVLGFPMELVGEERNFVIVRQGVLARIRDALANPDIDYLLDAFVFPGNSGGPVLLKPELQTIPDTEPIKLPLVIGVVKEPLSYAETAYSLQTKRPRITFEENSGLTRVVPIDRVQECIDEFEATMPPETSLEAEPQPVNLK